MTATDTYRAALTALPAAEWDAYLLAYSNLPGPRGNLELAAAAADLGDEAQFRRWTALGPDAAAENTPGCFLAFCGVVGLGRLLGEWNSQQPSQSPPAWAAEQPKQVGLADVAAVSNRRADLLTILRALAADPRWRIREGVAMALQRWGDADMDGLLVAMADWARGNPLEQRAAAAALCEPRLLKSPEHAAATLRILDAITASIPEIADRKSAAFKTLRQGLAYCWSVAVAALPDAGKPLMEKWLVGHDTDPDIRWIMRENLKKNRLVKLDAAWVAEQVQKGNYSASTA